MPPTLSPLRQLVKIITENVDLIEAEADKQGVIYPTIDDLYNPASPAEQLAANPSVMEAAALVASAASQLAATVKFPAMTLTERVLSFHAPSCLRAVADSGVVEILRETGPKGLHIKELGERAKVDSAKLGRMLRLLATHYIFREVEPNVFAHNRLSILLDTGKSSEAVVNLSKKLYKDSAPGNPLNTPQPELYDATGGPAALFAHCTDECFKSSGYLAESFILNDVSMNGFQRAFNFSGDIFEFGEKYPGYVGRQQAAYASSSKLEPPDVILKGFDWNSLRANSLVVDVGGGNGSLSALIAARAPQLKVMVEDREEVINGPAQKYWSQDSGRKELMQSGRVTLKVHNFFEEQPADISGKIDMYVLRYILHDWPTETCIKLLELLHSAAAPGGRLLIVDCVVSFACDASNIGANIPGAITPAPPAPLVANLGLASAMPYYADLQMMTCLQAQERTLSEFIDLTKATGWNIVRVYQPVGSSLKQIECVKA